MSMTVFWVLFQYSRFDSSWCLFSRIVLSMESAKRAKGGEGALNQTLMNIFSGSTGVFTFCQSYPAIRFFLSPPNVRNKPTWYPRFRPTILQCLQQIMLGRPLNLQLLEDHPGDLDPDGIHFSIMAGVSFVQDLHDQALRLLLSAPTDPKIR